MIEKSGFPAPAVISDLLFGVQFILARSFGTDLEIWRSNACLQTQQAV